MNEILKSFSFEEIETTDEEKEILRSAIALLLRTNGSFTEAVHLAKALKKVKMNPKESFVKEHDENDPKLYTTQDSYRAFVMLFYARKADNLYNLSCEGKNALRTHFKPVSVNDSCTCESCYTKSEPIALQDANYDNVPPYHIGCRCTVEVL